MPETAATISVPFLDLGHSHEPLKDSLLAEFEQLIDSNAFINGPQVEAFEQAWAAYCGAERCVGVASGLDALRLALIAAGIEQGDEVIVPAHTFVATFEAVTQAGGIPVPVDVSMKDYNLDLSATAAAISPRTRFLMPVHLYGQLCDLHALGRVATGAGVTTIEDACQAHGATRAGIRPGEKTLAAAFSFYPGKNLGAMGDAGALVTNDQWLADRVAALREHGQRAKYRHVLEGYTARLDTIQAIVLLRKLDRTGRMEQRTARHRERVPEPAPGRRRSLAPTCPGRQRAGLASVCRAHWITDEPGGVPRSSRHWNGQALSRAPALVGGVQRARVSGGPVPDYGENRARGALAAYLPRYDGEAGRRCDRRCDSVLRQWLTAQRTTHRSG